MTTRQLAAMEAGRVRAARIRRRDAVARVRAFEQWSPRGVIAGIPVIPSDADFKMAREAK